MALLPTVPSFTSTDSSLTKLQQLSQAVSFLVDFDVRPLWHFYNTATQAVTSGSWTTLTKATNVAWDTDGVQSSGAAVIVTQGYYVVEACVPWESIAGANGLFARFLYTAGPNGTLTNGTTIAFGTRGGQAVQSSAQDTVINIQDSTPVCCYPGDSIKVQGFCASNATINFNQNTNYMSGRFAFNFTGMWDRTGP